MIDKYKEKKNDSKLSREEPELEIWNVEMHEVSHKKGR